jgi:hypothetical protein
MAIDIPNIPPQTVPVIIAQAEQSQASTVQVGRILGVCHVVSNSQMSLANTIAPKEEAIVYLENYEKKEIKDTVPATIYIMEQPMHGILRLLVETDRGIVFSRGAAPLDPANPGYLYIPQKGYIGKDGAIMLVDIGGIKVKVMSTFKVVGDTYNGADLCGKRKYGWKISSSFSPVTNRLLIVS